MDLQSQGLQPATIVASQLILPDVVCSPHQSLKGEQDHEEYSLGYQCKRLSDAKPTARQQNLRLQGLFDGVAAVATVDCDLDLQTPVAGEE